MHSILPPFAQCRPYPQNQMLNYGFACILNGGLLAFISDHVNMPEPFKGLRQADFSWIIMLCRQVARRRDYVRPPWG
jgi:hypothetical protein